LFVAKNPSGTGLRPVNESNLAPQTADLLGNGTAIKPDRPEAGPTV